MPELPEVEATRRYLINQDIEGRVFTDVHLTWARSVQSPSEAVFSAGIIGAKVDHVARRAKFILVRLSRPQACNAGTLLIHLRMTGALVVLPSAESKPRFSHNVFVLDDGRDLCFVDPRKLGKLRLVQDEAEVLGHLGPEPLDPGFTIDVLWQQLVRGRGPVKAQLCDQTVVAGIGNIYADEALFMAKLHPLRRTAGLTQAEVQKLHAAILGVLSDATERLDAVMQDGSPLLQHMGEEHMRLQVPRAAGQPCSCCSGQIERVVIQGRSAYYCPSRQQLLAN